MLAPRALNTTKNPVNFCSTYLSPVPYRHVACWTCRKGEIEIEVYYVGSREKAPY